jgi:hypothetical protein
MMGLITERGSAADGYAAVTVPPAPGEPAGAGAAMLHRRSALPSRRSVLYVHCQPGSFAPEDLARWYTERGFHFWIADLCPQDGQQGRIPGRRHARAGLFASLDGACRYLREAEGIDMIIVTADGGDAAIAAEWCDARRDARCADALILSNPVFGRRLRRGLDTGCPVLVLGAEGAQANRLALLRHGDQAAARLGPHVTWLRLQPVPGGPPAPGGEPGPDGQPEPAGGPGQPAGDRHQFFDEMGRWLGAYMYGQVRDQLL